jgi:beta-lactamase class A
MRRSILAVTAAVLFACSCTYRQEIPPIEFPSPPPVTIATPLPKLDTRRDLSLQGEFGRIAEQAQGRVGAAALLLETGQMAELRADEQFAMQSVYKLPITMAALYAEAQGKLSLDEKIAVKPSDFVRHGVRSPIRDQFPEGGEFTIRELMAQSMSESDGTASDVLMEQAGGPEAVGDYLGLLGIKEMHVLNSEKEIFVDWETQYRNSTTPRATIDLLRAVLNGGGIDDNARQELLYMMRESTPGGRRIKKLLPKDVEVAHKTGTGGNKDGVSAATNDVGIIYLPDGRHLLIAVYVVDSTAPAYVREKTIAEMAKAAWDKWVEGLPISAISNAATSNKLQNANLANGKQNSNLANRRSVNSKH